jgi:hypothetical protein
LTPKVDAALEKTKLLFEELAGLNLEDMRSRSKGQAQDVSTPRSCQEPTGVRLASKGTCETVEVPVSLMEELVRLLNTCREVPEQAQRIAAIDRLQASSDNAVNSVTCPTSSLASTAAAASTSDYCFHLRDLLLPPPGTADTLTGSAASTSASDSKSLADISRKSSREVQEPEVEPNVIWGSPAFRAGSSPVRARSPSRTSAVVAVCTVPCTVPESAKPESCRCLSRVQTSAMKSQQLSPRYPLASPLSVRPIESSGLPTTVAATPRELRPSHQSPSQVFRRCSAPTCMVPFAPFARFVSNSQMHTTTMHPPSQETRSLVLESIQVTYNYKTL